MNKNEINEMIETIEVLKDCQIELDQVDLSVDQVPVGGTARGRTSHQGQQAQEAKQLLHWSPSLYVVWRSPDRLGPHRPRGSG